MKRRYFFFGFATAALSCTSGKAPRLNVFNWDNYVAPQTIPQFEKRFACQVRYGVYASAEEMLAKVMSGNSGWDVVFPSNSYVGPMCEMSLLRPLDHSRLGNLGHLEERFQKPDWDPNLHWCVPFMHSATGILYSKTVQPTITSWDDLWQDRYGRRVTMLDDPAEVFAAALKRLGQSVNAEDATILQKARNLAVKQKPLLRAYLNEEVRDQVITGDVLAAQMWAQVAQVALDNSPNLAFVFPREGFPLYADNACILRESKHVDLAYEFLNYLLEPAVAAQIAESITGATTNRTARNLLPQKLRSNPILFPSPEILSRGEWFRAVSPSAMRLRDQYWTEIKSA